MKLVLITGASSGIGKQLAALYDSKNISTLIVGRDSARLQEVASTLHSCQGVFVADLATPEGRECVKGVLKVYVPDVVINNAGFGVYGKAFESSKCSEMLDVNAKAPLEITLAAIALYVEKGMQGTVLNVSSIAGELTNPLSSVYGATKSFLTRVSKALDFEMRGSGIRILVALPGMCDTPFALKAAGRGKKEALFWKISSTKAAQEIYWQIERKKGVHLFDFRYKIALFLTQFVPEFFIKKTLMKAIEKRI